MTKLTATAFLFAATGSTAFAHPVHLASEGHGHSHWVALAIGAGLVVYALAVLLRRRAAAKAEDTSR